MKWRQAGFTVLGHIAAVLLIIHGVVANGLISLSAPHRGTVLPQEVVDRVQASPSTASVSTAGDWPMVAANPQRTSWTSEEIRGRLNPIWYRVIEPYIPPKVQVIATGGLLYISTARGLYALDAETGDIAWVYPTELALGNSPTVFNGVVYVGGFDHKLHAINAQTGAGIWTYEAEAGFETNPLVLDIGGHTYVYAGNRDGYMYAIEDRGSWAELRWRYKTDGHISFSAAYKDNVIYFASNDAHAYALDAQTGNLVWKSTKLPGAGFKAWWPVVYEDPTSGTEIVVLAGSDNYRAFLAPAYGHGLQGRELGDIYADIPQGETIAPIQADGLMDITRVLEYYEQKPWRRTYLMLDASSGTEITFSYQRQDGTSGMTYAPILWLGTHSGNRYPPAVGPDGILYQPMHYISNPYIGRGGIVGWRLGESSVHVTSHRNAMDEPIAYALGTSLLYWNRCNDRVGAAFDVNTDESWTWFSYGLDTQIPEYNQLYEALATDYTINNLFSGPDGSSNGIYGQHGHQNPPIPYGGKVYMHRSNAVIAFGDYQDQPTHLPMAETVASPDAQVTVDIEQLRQKLTAEVRKIVDAGHLRPGYRSVGLFDGHTRDQYGDHLIDYWHHPSDILYALILTLPYLPQDLQQEVKIYMQNEYTNYPPHQYTHIGWRDGAPREPFDLPQEVEADRINHPPKVSGWGFDGWLWPPHTFYALWQYAQAVGSAQEIFEDNRSRLETPPSDAYLIEYPYIHNAYIAGYLGYLELEALAGYPESADVRAELNRLLNLRVSTFSKDTPYTNGRAARALSVARNFMFLVPELGQYLHDNVLLQVEEAIEEYEVVAPYWFVADHDTTQGEGSSHHFFDYHALFQAKALILQESGDELLKYLDVPATQVGDLFYIQNLVAAIGPPCDLDKVATPSVGMQRDSITYTLSFFGYTGTLSLTDTLPMGVSAPIVLAPEGTIVIPALSYDSIAHRLTWSDTLSTGQRVTMGYQVTITTDAPSVLVNTLELSEAGGVTNTTVARVLANPFQVYLPLIIKENQ